jgi:hypothetical protein
VFYNNSAFDGIRDDNAIATDKVALLPGQTATFANYSSYSGGINGMIVDLAHRPDQAIGVDDFEFRVGNDNDPSRWSAAPAPSGISVLRGEGVDGSDRVILTWPDNVIQKQWLQITVKATAATGLTAPDVFYFGNAIGESGDSAVDAYVGVRDQLMARLNVVAADAAIDNVYDYNRDGRVDSADELLARDNATSPVSGLRLITSPTAAAVEAMFALQDDGDPDDWRDAGRLR